MQYKDNTAASAGNGVRTALAPLALIISLFFFWGAAASLNDILIKQFKKAFELSDLQAGLVQSAFYLGYFLFAMPAAVFMRRYSYKAAVVLGLLLFAAGAFLFYPAAAIHTYGVFLLALFVIASGLAFLETSANSLVIVLGPAEGAARRLNLAQAFNPLGAMTGVMIGSHFIFSGVEYGAQDLAAMTPTARVAYFATESAAVQMPYLAIGTVVLLWVALVAWTKFPTTRDEGGGHKAGTGAQLKELLRNRNFVFAVVAQLFYVGAQVGVWSYLIRYFQDVVPGTPEKTAAGFLTLSLALFMCGRFAGAALLRKVSPAYLLAAFALIDLLLCIVAIALPGWIGLYALVGVSIFMSIMFPTIFVLGLSGMDDDHRKLGSSMLVMAIVGGALLPALMGAVSDAAGIHWSIAVPAIGFIVILAFALRARRVLR
ncbi:MAG: L-fucose:H+ symporter permease [Proteobacteria bacterium]|nr:L-fucose:H+ symporter permease [Pseudomonadota bacterium]